MAVMALNKQRSMGEVVIFGRRCAHASTRAEADKSCRYRNTSLSIPTAHSGLAGQYLETAEFG
jgi:hypothetical protein